MELKIKQFESQQAWSDWLNGNHGQTDGVWLKFAKKNSGHTTVNYAEAVEEALCYGWIDSQTKSLDSKFYLQKFSPRRARSIWSKINVAKVETLLEAGKIKPSGLAQIESAKADGRWAAAYASPRETEIPDYFLKALGKNIPAKDFFESINKSNKYAIAWRLHQAKRPETKQRLAQKFIEMLAAHKTIH